MKSRQSERERHISTLRIPNEFRRRAAASDDAFDAAVSVVVMSASLGELLALQSEPDDLIQGDYNAVTSRIGNALDIESEVDD